MSKSQEIYDVAIVGGGVIGLSIAWRLSDEGQSVCLIDRAEPGKGASWAASGMIPPGPRSFALVTVFSC